MTDFAPMKNDILLRTAWGKTVDRPPIWVMRQAGRYLPEYHEEKGNKDFFECCRDPETASNLTIQPIDRYPKYIDAAIIFSDILVVPQAMGMEVVMIDKQGPHFPNPLRLPSDQQWIDVVARDANVEESLAYVYKAITLTRKKLQGRVPLIGFCGAPWTLLCYMVEGGGSRMFFHIKHLIFTYPAECKAILQKIADVCVDYLAQQVKAGAQIIQVFDSWAGELSPAAFQEFALPYLTFIADRLPEKLQRLGLETVPMIVFAKGAWYALEDLCKTKYNVIGLDWLHDPTEAFKITQAHGKVLQGNMDPGLLYGNEVAIAEAVKRMSSAFHKGRQGWIANLGHGGLIWFKHSLSLSANVHIGVTPYVKPDKLEYYFEKIHEYTR